MTDLWVLIALPAACGDPIGPYDSASSYSGRSWHKECFYSLRHVNDTLSARVPPMTLDDIRSRIAEMDKAEGTLISEKWSEELAAWRAQLVQWALQFYGVVLT